MSGDSPAIVNAQAAGRCMGRVHSNLRWGQREAREAARVVASWPLTPEAWGSVLSTAQACCGVASLSGSLRSGGSSKRVRSSKSSSAV